MTYRPGDYYLTCQRTGEKIRRSQAVRQWDSLIVKKGHEDPKHPLDMPRHPSKPYVPTFTSPEPPDRFIGPGDVTEDDL